MKKIPLKIKLILALIALTCLPFLCHGQTNVPTTNSPISMLPGGASQLAGDFLAFFNDAKPYFTNSARVGVYGLYGSRLPVTPSNPSPKKDFGGFITAGIPLNNSGQLSMSFAAGYVGTHFYDASFAPQLGTTWNLPVIGPTYSWVESGPGYDFFTHNAIVHSALGVSKKFTLFKVDFAATIGTLNISDRDGVNYFGGLSGGLHF